MRPLLKVLCIATILLASCEKQKSNKTEVTILAETTKSWNGDTLPNYPKGQPKVTILKIIIPPKTSLDPHLHPVINAGVLIKGTLTIVDENGNTLNLKAGDAIVELVNTIHYGKNTGDVPAEIIVFYAGTDDLPISVHSKKVIVN